MQTADAPASNGPGNYLRAVPVGRRDQRDPGDDIPQAAGGAPEQAQAVKAIGGAHQGGHSRPPGGAHQETGRPGVRVPFNRREQTHGEFEK